MASQGHIPVLLNEIVEFLAPSTNDRFLDGTLGAGGHAEALLRASAPGGRLLGLDRDAHALAEAHTRLASFGERVRLHHGSFADAATILSTEPDFQPLTKILLDLGVSSPELELSGRGFSFQKPDEALDMRFDPDTQTTTAASLLATTPEMSLADLLWLNGEEPLARKIAAAIAERRKTLPLTTVADLVDVVQAVYRRRHYHDRSRINPSTRTFQALRIAVNDELKLLERSLPQLLALLAPGGRIAVISFHSLEDRIVKTWFRRESRDCICPPSFPECRCGHHASITLVTKHVIISSDQEQKENPRSRSAKLRVAEKNSPV